MYIDQLKMVSPAKKNTAKCFKELLRPGGLSVYLKTNARTLEGLLCLVYGTATRDEKERTGTERPPPLRRKCRRGKRKGGKRRQRRRCEVSNLAPGRPPTAPHGMGMRRRRVELRQALFGEEKYRSLQAKADAIANAMARRINDPNVARGIRLLREKAVAALPVRTAASVASSVRAQKRVEPPGPPTPWLPTSLAGTQVRPPQSLTAERRRTHPERGTFTMVSPFQVLPPTASASSVARVERAQNARNHVAQQLTAVVRDPLCRLCGSFHPKGDPCIRTTPKVAPPPPGRGRGRGGKRGGGKMPRGG
jgi:hypothetical protein